MEEKPKNFWRKPWKGWSGLCLWLVALFVIAFVLFFFGGFILANNNSRANLMRFALIGAFVSTLAGIFVVLFVHFVRWLCCWHNFKRAFFGLACFITLATLFYAEENWRGHHAWEQFKQAQAARGEKFDWESVVPPSVPNDQNFAFSPVWIAAIRYGYFNDDKIKAWYGDRAYSQEISNLASLFPISPSTVVGTNMWLFPQPPEISDAWTSGKTLDLKRWQSFYRDVGSTNPRAGILIAPQPQTSAQDVLLALSKFDPAIERLRQDSKLPYSRFPIQYNNGMPAAILLPHLAAEKKIAEVLQLRAVAELKNDENEKALDDVKLMFRLVDASRNESFLICHLVRLALLNLTLQPVWEGLAEQKWSDAQLVDLDLELAKSDFLADGKFSMRGERGLEIASIEFLQHPTMDLQFNRPRLSFLMPMLPLMQALANMSSDNDVAMNVPRTLALAIGPSGWLEQNKLRIAQFNSLWQLPVIDENAKVVSPAKFRAAQEALNQEKQHLTLDNALVPLFIPDLRNAVEKFAHAQSAINLARVAIALERYRLTHGEFPESLAALTPQFIAEIPHDVIGGGPLCYRRTSDGLFVLYSVGWNETDDGGVVVLDKGKNPREESNVPVDISAGDWVWKYPAK